MNARIVDQTVVACVLHPDHAVDRATLAALADAFPLDTVTTVAPMLRPHDHGADELGPVVDNAPVVWPVDGAARDLAIERLHARGPRTLIDPQGFTLGEAPPEHVALPRGWTREAQAWLPTAAQDDRDPIAMVYNTLDALPDGTRLAVHDPHGRLTPERVAAIAAAPGTERLTLHLENTRGLAVAAARTALARRDGPHVATALLGLGPRTGLPATELLVAPDDRPGLVQAAERAALVTGRMIPTHHPFWGPERDLAAEPALLAQDSRWTARPNPATLPQVLDQYLADWGLEVPVSERQRILDHLAARLRPGERIQGPVLYAMLATHLDLTRLARPGERR